jgi:hypothetical protein
MNLRTKALRVAYQGILGSGLIIARLRYEAQGCLPRCARFRVGTYAFTSRYCLPRQKLKLAYQGTLGLGLAIPYLHRCAPTKRLRVTYQGVLGSGTILTHVHYDVAYKGR